MPTGRDTPPNTEPTSLAAPSAWAEIIALMDVADEALDNETYEQSRREQFDAPDDMEFFVTVGTIRKINKLFSALNACRNASPVAPDLLAALKVADTAINDCLSCRSHLAYDAARKVRAAIALGEGKALGEPA